MESALPCSVRSPHPLVGPTPRSTRSRRLLRCGGGYGSPTSTLIPSGSHVMTTPEGRTTEPSSCFFLFFVGSWLAETALVVVVAVTTKFVALLLFSSSPKLFGVEDAEGGGKPSSFVVVILLLSLSAILATFCFAFPSGRRWCGIVVVVVVSLL